MNVMENTMELPRDAKGNVIHVGDNVMFGSGGEHEVVGVAPTWVCFVQDERIYMANCVGVEVVIDESKWDYVEKRPVVSAVEWDGNFAQPFPRWFNDALDDGRLVADSGNLKLNGESVGVGDYVLHYKDGSVLYCSGETFNENFAPKNDSDVI